MFEYEYECLGDKCPRIDGCKGCLAFEERKSPYGPWTEDQDHPRPNGRANYSN